jgi:hypothetical protein
LRQEEEGEGQALRPALAACLALLVLAPGAAAAGPEGGLEGRGWEMVSAAEKNGGEVTSPAAPGAGALQAAAQGGAIAYASDASFGQAEGAAPVSQYVARRGAGGWSTANVTPPLLSGTYEGGAYLLFSGDLSRALLTSGWRCRGDGSEECEAENPPLAPDAPAGYRNLYLRDNVSTAYTPLITSADLPTFGLGPEELHPTLLGASADLGEVTISVDGSSYEWSGGALTAIPAPLDWEAEFDPGGAEVTGVLGASTDRSYVYYLNASGLWLWHGDTNLKVAASADASNYPAGTGTARVTPDGARLAFLSSQSLTGYPNNGRAEVYLYEAPSNRLICASCNPKGTVPKGPSTIPGARVAGDGGPPLYKPRSLSADGRRLFFDSEDALLAVDTDRAPDVYQWVAKGAAGCAKTAGCVGLVSSGRLGADSFVDASADGNDAFFLTPASLLPGDPGGLDLYDARVGGGFPEPAPPIPCVGDACQGPALVPGEPSPATSTIAGRGNPSQPRVKKPRCKKGRRRRGRRCVRRRR